jgi:hypothetical protein
MKLTTVVVKGVRVMVFNATFGAVVAVIVW